MIALQDTRNSGIRIWLEVGDRTVRLTAQHDDDSDGSHDVEVPLDDAEAWLTLMLDRVRAAKAVKP